MATLSYTKPTVGASTDTWGDTLNANWDSVAAVLGTVDSTDIQKLEAITATAAELNVLDGITASVTELNYTDGVTSNIQTQLNAKAPIASPTFTGTATIPTAAVTTVDLGNWTITESAGVLYFATGGTNKMKLDASGNLTVTGDVTAYGTV